MRAFILAVTGLALAVAACSSYGTSVVEVENQQAQVASVIITLPSPSLPAGQRQRASVTLKDANGAALRDRAILWYTSASSVATVTDSGDVLGVAPGAATLSAVSEGVAGQAALTVIPRPPAPVAKVLVAINPAAVVVGQTAHATVALQDSIGNLLTDRSVNWQSGNPSVATVSADGDISALAPGTAAITAASEGQTASASLSVSAPAPVPVATVSVSPATSTLQVGATVQLSATTRDANNNVLTGRVVAWSSSDASKATVNSSGLVTAVSSGPAQITASSEGKSSSATITVSAPAPVPVATVSVSPASASLLVGATVQLSATMRDANNNVLTGRQVTWSSSDVTNATVNSSGLVTAVSSGPAQITASSEGRSGSSTIAVSAPAPAPVATVTVSPASGSVAVGATVQLSATMRDASNNVLTGRQVTWSSSNAGIASVNSNGLVQGVSTGPATITATSETIPGTASFTVTAPPPPPPPGSSNEPTGMTFINERKFDTPSDPAWYWTNAITVVSDASAPKSPSNIGRLTYTAGFPSGSAPGHTDFAFGNRPRVAYVSHWGRLSSNWYGEASGTNKICYFWANGSLVPFFISAEGSGTSALTPVIKTQALLAPAGNTNYSPNLVPSARIVRGQWFHLEIIANGNTSGRADGSIELYLNGVHIGSYTGLQFTSGTTAWSEYRWYPVWGGNNGPTLPVTQYQDVDNIYISGKN